MLPPFVETEKKTHRLDNQGLSRLEEEGIEEIGRGLQKQLNAIRQAAGRLAGDSVGQVVVAMTTAVEGANDSLYDSLLTFMLGGALLGVEDAAANLPFEAGVGFSWELASAEARAFVEEYSFDLVTGINQTTQEGLRQAVLKWIEDGGRLEDLAEDIRPIFANEPATRRIEALFNVDRARMIAETEATRAYTEGKIRAYTANGLAERPPEKRPPDDSHVRCRCDVSLVQMDDGAWHWVWFTVNDERVCPVCGPRHGQSVGIAKEAVRVEE